MVPSISNFGAYCTSRVCGLATATAAGTGDATAVTGATIDRQGFGSAKVVVCWLTTLTAAKTLSLAVAYQDSADGSSWNTAVALQAATVMATGELTASKDEVEFNLDMSGLQRYVRINFTPDLSHTGTDTAVVAATIILGGADELPAA
jgi:hypothetical protein